MRAGKHTSENILKAAVWTVCHLQSVGQLWVPASVTQRCSMWWLASRPPTLLPATPAVFSITMRSCGVVNLPTMTPLSPFPSVLSLSLHISSFPLVFISSLTNTCSTDYFLSSCHIHSLNFIRSIANLLLFPPPSTRRFSTGHPLTQLFGALAVARQLSKFHQSIKVAFGSHGYSWRREYVLGETENRLIHLNYPVFDVPVRAFS